MPRHFKAARLWTAVAAAVLIAGTVSALGHGATEVAALHPAIFSGAI
ncbi:hypothetical protein [Pararhodobacter sp.]|nr:hypothetical protein [Pararhodobacter sp.]